MSPSFLLYCFEKNSLWRARLCLPSRVSRHIAHARMVLSIPVTIVKTPIMRLIFVSEESLRGRGAMDFDRISKAGFKGITELIHPFGPSTKNNWKNIIWGLLRLCLTAQIRSGGHVRLSRVARWRFGFFLVTSNCCCGVNFRTRKRSWETVLVLA
jgi:hypothetical protein